MSLATPELMASDKITSLLGFDYGLKRIGIATGQTITRTATPVTTLTQKKGETNWSGIEEQIQQWKPDALIVGIPYHVDGSESNMTKLATKFYDSLTSRFDLPVYKINETLSSKEAEEKLKETMKIGQQNKQEIDKMAAAIIVQSWLNQH